ncbi:hypothetical protein, partial [Pedobacter ghigonis]|uniref:hypothetical protein n=1 Tax=Pedobacter ghigonis TaxID=2730403 RepID=UPI001C37A8D3
GFFVVEAASKSSNNTPLKYKKRSRKTSFLLLYPFELRDFFSALVNSKGVFIFSPVHLHFYLLRQKFKGLRPNHN